MEINFIENLNLKIEVDYIDMVNYSLAHNDFAILKNIHIVNESELNDVNHLNIRIFSNSDFIYDFEQFIPNISSEKDLNIISPKIEYNYDFFRDITERIKTHFFIEISNESKEIIFSKAYKVNILPFQHWLGTNIYPQLTAAYIVSNDQEIKRIVSQAGEKLKIWTGNPSFDGYQSSEPERVRLQAAAIYAALQRENIAYKNPPASFERFGQNIRYPQEIIKFKNGTCLDLTFLFAGCLEAVGIHPILIFTKGHAFVGFWLQDKNFAESCIRDYATVTKRFSKGINEIELVETTTFVNGKDYSFEESVEFGHQNLDTPYNFECAIDVTAARFLGINPVITKSQQNDFKMIDYGENENITEAPTTVFEQHDNIEYKVNPLEKTDIWSRNLLDLSLRNSLINFKMNKNAFQLMVHDVASLEDELASSKNFDIIEKPEILSNIESDGNFYNAHSIKTNYKNMIDADFKDGRIRSFLTEYMLNKQLKGLYKKAKSDLDENGASSLFVAIGFLSLSNGKYRTQLAPLVLLPLSIDRKNASSRFYLELSEEEPQFNVTLVEYLRQNFNIDLRHLINLPKDEKGVDIPRLFTTIRKAIMDKEGWEIEEIAVISNFSFKKFVMWNDLQSRNEEIVSNTNVNSLITGNYKLDRELENLNARKIEKELMPSEIIVGSLVDASQLEAIKASEKSSFVLHGPPGTGKSQTITNMIIHNLNKGKKILFVAEKQAALNVVNERLRKLGLEENLLELHSNKTKKNIFLDKIDKSLALVKDKTSLNIEEKSKHLYELKNKLSKYVESLHQQQDTGLSIYELIQRYEKYSYINKGIKIDKKVVQTLTDSDIENVKEIATVIDNTKKQLKIDIKRHPLKLFDINKYSISKRDSLKYLNAKLEQAFGNLIKKLSLFDNRGIYNIETIKDLLFFEALVNEVLLYDGKENIDIKMLNSSNKVNLLDAFEFAKRTLTTYRSTRKLLLPKYNEKVLSINASFLLSEYEESKNKVGLFKNRKLRQLINHLEVELKENDELNESDFKNDLTNILDFQKARETLRKRNDNFLEVFGNSWNGRLTDLGELEKQVSFIENRGLNQLSSDEQNIYLELITYKLNNAILFNEMKENFDIIHIEINELIENYSIDKNYLYNIKLSKFSSEVKVWNDGITDLKNWTLINNQFSKINEILNSNIKTQYLNLESDKSLKDLILKEIVENLIKYYFLNNELLDSFNGFEVEENIKFLKEKVSEFNDISIEHTQQVISNNLCEKRKDSLYENEFLFLQKAIRSKGRGQSIRNIFNKTSSVIQDVFPIMLMSPLSVAQYIDPEFPKFDLIIFDEASQIPTDIAVGAISRANNCVVVGDPKQMPPTSFFGTNNSDENNLELEDLESLLDDCLAANFPEKHLKWHYRSRHESLIHYSNRTYYNNALFTYPSSDALKSKVTFNNVQGNYERGSSRVNKEEANYIVKRLVEYLKSDSQDSVGVITFNIQQQELIDNLLDEQLIKYKDLDAKNSNAKESIFIKNLENVQGDERDIILFSTTFGPDPEGKFTMNFGPLNSEGGWRRLNVAITRARKEMNVVSSFNPEEIDLNKTKSEGVRGLKGFMEYARNSDVLPVIISESYGDENGIATVLKNEIAKYGFDSFVNFGNSDFKIDLAIKNPQNKQKYIMGVIIDGKNYYNAQTSVDRNVIQPGVLKDLDWNIERIWSIDWYEDRDRQINKIINKLNHIVEEKKYE